MTIAYDQEAYWNQRFETERHYEWFHSFAHYLPIIHPFLLNQKHFIMPGIGTSQMPQDLLVHCEEAHVTAVDFSKVLIDRLQQENQSSQITFLCADVTCLPLESMSFDVALEKSLLDALACADNTGLKMRQIVSEIGRVLKINGLYIVISYSSQRSVLFDNFYSNEWYWKEESISKVDEPKNEVEMVSRPTISQYIYIYRKCASDV